MNIIGTQEARRRVRITMIRKEVVGVFAKGKNIDYEKLVNMSCLDFGTSRRYVLELLKIALCDIPHEINEIEGVKSICQKK